MTQTITSELILPEIAKESQFPPGSLWSEEPPLESDKHREQIELLIRLLKWWWRERNDFYVTGNLTVYYSPNQKKSEHFRGPDFLVVLGTEQRDRKSWTVWEEEGKYPNVIVELLSDSTAAVDRGLKKQIYQDTFRTLDYFWFDPVDLEFKGFHLVEGQYQEIVPNERGWMWSQQLGLYLGIYQNRLRFFTEGGDLVLFPEEEMQQQVEQERQRAERESQQAQAERQRAERESQQAQAERQRADRAEQELERLRSQLRDRGIQLES